VVDLPAQLLDGAGVRLLDEEHCCPRMALSQRDHAGERVVGDRRDCWALCADGRAVESAEHGPRNSLLVVAAITGSALAVPPPAASPASTTVLRLDGIGPLHLGMTRTAALATGWLADRGPGCPLGGTPPITYPFSGAEAPEATKGSAEFADGRFTALSFTRGVRTSTGVTVGRTTTARMVARYCE
jgi:hypothetical protein